MQGVNHGTSIHHPEREDNTRQIPTPLEHDYVQPGADTHGQHVVDPNPGKYSPKATIVAISSIDNPCEGPVPNDSSAEPRMIGDFHGSTNSLWSLYGKEAKSHDEARIQPLKEDMDGVLILFLVYVICGHFGRLFASSDGHKGGGRRCTAACQWLTMRRIEGLLITQPRTRRNQQDSTQGLRPRQKTMTLEARRVGSRH